MTNWDLIVVEPIRTMLTAIAGFIPTLFGALVILIVGWICAKVIREIILRLLKAVKFENISEKAGISEVLRQGGIKTTASEMISRLVYWLVMITVLVVTINALGLTVASQLLERLTAYIPRVISSLFALIIGMFLANVVASIVRTTASNARIPKPELLGSLSKWAILLFTIMIFLDELGIASVLVSVTFNIFFGAVCVALALAFGLGGKDVAEKYLKEFIERLTK